MANIIAKIAQIRAAILGIDVRESIASGIESINTEVISTTARQTVVEGKENVLEGQFGSLVINAGSSNAEIVAGRTSSVTSVTFDTMGHRADGVDAQFNKFIANNANNVNGLDYGVIMNDNSIDNAPFINNAINDMEILGGGTVNLPTGQIFIESSIILKPYVRLKGAGKTRRDGSTKGTVIICASAISTAPVTMIEGSGIGYQDNYLYGSILEDFSVYGNEYTTGLNRNYMSMMVMRNINILYHDKGMINNGCMLDDFYSVAITHCYGVCLSYLHTSSVSTTQRWYNAYIGQCATELSSVPLRVESYAVTDLKFYQLTLESNPNAVEIGRNTNVDFYGIYIENFPSGGGLINPLSVFLLGKFNVSDDGAKIAYDGNVHFYGGFISGISIGLYTTHILFNLDYSSSFSAEGLYYRRIGNPIATTANTKAIPTFMNCLGENGLVTSDIDLFDPNKINVINCTCGNRGTTTRYVIKSVTSLITLLNGWVNLGSGYQGLEAYITSDNELVIEGTLTGGTSTTICTLPVGLRPSILKMCLCYMIISGSWTAQPCFVYANGDVIQKSPAATGNLALKLRFKLS